MLATRFTELVGCSVPIQQAGMGVLSPPELAAAVSEAGGLGMLGTVRHGGGTPTALGLMLERVKALTSRPFGVNFLMPFLDRACVEVAAATAGVVEFFYGEPDASLIAMVHAGGALASWQVGSREEAATAAAIGCDLIIAQGVAAGGHIRGGIGLLALLDEALGAVTVPVLAAGGIGTGRAMAAALAAGAAGVRVGTRFVAASEYTAHPAYVDALIGARSVDTVLTETFSVGWPNAPHRVLRSCVDAAQAFPSDVVGEVLWPGAPDSPMRIPRFASMLPTRQTTGAIQAMTLAAGESVSAVKRVQSAAEIVHELASEAEELLRCW